VHEILLTWKVWWFLESPQRIVNLFIGVLSGQSSHIRISFEIKRKLRLNSDLQTLIKELETEKADLLRLIDIAVKEQEFLNAHFHSEALGQINRRLQTLKNLDDELYHKKYFLERVIENLRKQLQEETADNLKSMTNRLIDDKEKELNDLNQTPKKQKNDNGKSHLRDYLNHFVKGRIRGLRIIFCKTDNVLIEIRRTKAGAKLTMPNIKKIMAENLLSDEGHLKLKGLGFSLNNEGDKVTTILAKSKYEMTDEIMKVVSLIVFEVFYFKELGNEAAIEILKKRTGLSDKK
jgi:hypothetical protein